VSNGSADLEAILPEASRATAPVRGRVVRPWRNAEPRWDATYHAGLPAGVHEILERKGQKLLRVGDVATLSTERVDPRRLGRESFAYIEIGDVDADGCAVRAKEIRCRDAPTRARKLVRAGDVLFSTVRPERRAVGIVPPDLDAAVCSTGFAVLRPKGINSLVLAALLRSGFANAQVMRNNTGIAYPAIDESCLLSVVLPANREDLGGVEEKARALQLLRARAAVIENDLANAIDAAIMRWSRE
jgi:hypothetical protein